MMTDEPSSDSPRITPKSGSAGFDVSAPEVWLHATFAPKWFLDMSHEATLQGGDARRREIVFAVCFVESYLLEWTRDEPLKRDFRALDAYFPADDREGITGRWKTVTKNLLADGRIRAHPDYSRSAAWTDFIKLVRYRDGLVHARTGRPQTGDTPRDSQPTPTIDELNKTPAGWPVRAAVALVRELHVAVRTDPPEWLVDPT
jgi:hypothetical protein